MDNRCVADSAIADYEIGNLCIDYVNNSVVIEMKTPRNVSDTLRFDNFEEVSITRKELWGAGIYVAASEVLNCGDKMVVEIQLNSGDMIRIITHVPMEKTGRMGY